ncbi:MAG TPA: histidine kinase, partial [Burkholderiaceae bacterium]
MSAARDAGIGPASALATDSVAASEATTSGFTSTGIDPSSVMPSGSEPAARGVAAGRWLGWRRRALVGLALLGCVGLFALLRTLSATPFVDAAWRTNAKGQLVLAGSGDAQAQKFIGETVLGVAAEGGGLLPPEVLLARRSPRWVLDDAERRQYLTDGAAFAKVVQQDAVRLRLAESGATVEVRTVQRGYAGLGSMFWLMTALALVFYLIGAVVVLVQPDERNLLYGLVALAQTTHLLLIGLDTLPGFGMPA